MFRLPAGFPGIPSMPGECKAVRVETGRRFGAFEEKTLVCNRAARQAIDQLCWQGGFTQAWEDTDSQEIFTMTKIPAIILVKLMLGLAPDQQEVVNSLVGAYAICMDPSGKPPSTPAIPLLSTEPLTASARWALAVRTCMNVIVGRRSDGQGGFVLDKFSLYYPDNSAVSGNNWDLLQGYSFRTAALSGSLNRAGLRGLRSGSIPVAEGTEFEAATHGLVIDDESAYEDCAYVEIREGETNSDREQRIGGMIDGMVAAYGSQGILSLSYDPAERQQGMTALESEWILLKRVAAEERALAAAQAAAASPPPPVTAPAAESEPEPEPDPEQRGGRDGDVGPVVQAVESHMGQHTADLAADGVPAAGVESHLQHHLRQHLQAHTRAAGGTN